MKTILRLLFVLLIFTVTSCLESDLAEIDQNIGKDSVTLTPVPSFTLEKTPALSVEPLSTRTPIPTEIPTKVVPTQSTVKPPLVETVNEREVPVCTGKGSLVPNPDHFDGTIVYHEDRNEGLFTFHMNNNTETLIAENVFSDLGFSPNGGWLAYIPEIEVNNGKRSLETFPVVLIENNGEIIETTIDTSSLSENISVGTTIGAVELNHWINDALINIILLAWNPNQELVSFIEEVPVVLDPFSGQLRTEMVDVLPNHYDNEHFDFSPDLERGLYFAKYGILVLWDMVHQKALLEDSDFDSFGFYLRPSQVDWSPDGSQVVVSGLRLSNRDEKLYYLISKNGILITDLNNFPADEFQPVRFSWSPDSRYLAMYNRGASNEIFIFDTQENIYLQKCPILDDDYNVRGLVWNPENSAVLYGDFDNKMRIIEVFSGITYELKQRGIPSGWTEEFVIPGDR